MKLKRKIKIKPGTYLILLIVIIMFVTFLMLNNFNKHIAPKITSILELKINKLSNDIIMQSFNQKLLQIHDLKNILKISKNKDDEIIAVDFDLEKAYAVSLDLTKNIKEALKQDNLNDLLDEEILKSEDHSYILFVPMGLATNNVYFNNLGPKIPIKIKFIGNLVTGLKTKVKDYGINSALIEIYINVSLNEEILIPFVTKKVNNDCEILLSSQIVEDLDGLLENNSSLINVPLTKE